jgi:hypothetical protein
MKQLIISILLSLFSLKMNAQHRINNEILQFIIRGGDTIFIYPEDIKIVDSMGFQLLDPKKIEKLEKREIEKVYFIPQSNSLKRVWMQNVISSSSPPGELYVSILGANEIHLYNKSIIQGSKELVQAIKERLDSH